MPMLVFFTNMHTLCSASIVIINQINFYQPIFSIIVFVGEEHQRRRGYLILLALNDRILLARCIHEVILTLLAGE